MFLLFESFTWVRITTHRDCTVWDDGILIQSLGWIALYIKEMENDAQLFIDN